MRMGFTFALVCSFVVRNGQLDRNDGPAAGSGMYAARASKICDALLNPEQAEAFDLIGIEPTPVVLDRKRKIIGFLVDADPDSSGVGMARAVVQRFLDDSVDACLVIIGKIVG